MSRWPTLPMHRRPAAAALTAAAGTRAIAYSDGALAAGAICTIAVDVTSATAARYRNIAESVTSSLGTSTAVSAGLRVDEAPLSVSMAFSPRAIAQGGVSRLTHTLRNDAAIGATSVALSDRLPPGVALADPPDAQTTCSGGRLTAAAGTRTIAYSEGALAAGASCTIAVDVTPATAARYRNIAESVTSSLGTSTAISAGLRVEAVEAPGFAKAFSPARVAPGGISRLTFTIDNAANAIAVRSLAFTDDFPDGMTVAAIPNGSTACGGTFAPAASATSLAFTGGRVASGEACTIALDVQAQRAGTLENRSGALTSDLPVTTSGARATLRVDEAPLSVSMAFSPRAIAQGGVSRLTHTLRNDAAIGATSVALSDRLPPGVALADPPDAQTTCSGGRLTAAAGTRTIAYSEGALAAGASCTIAVDVTPATAARYRNIAESVTSSLGTSTAISAGLRVEAVEAPGFAKAFSPARVAPGGISRLTFTIDNAANAIAVRSLAFTDDFPDGMTVAAIPNGSTACGGTFAPAASATSLAFTGGRVASGEACTIALDVQAQRAGTLENRSGALTSDLPVTTSGARATLRVDEAPLSVSMAFSPRAIAQGGVSRLTHTLRNDAAIGATSVALSDRLPPGVALADPPDAQTTCSGGRLTAAAGTRTIAYSEGALAAGASCTIAVDVTPATAARYRNIAQSVTSSLGTSTAISAGLRVEAVEAPGFAKAFSPARVAPGGISRLTFTIDNAANAIAVRSLAFTDDFPDGMTVAAIPNGSTACGGTFAPAASATSLAFTGGRVASGEACTIALDVQAQRAGTLENRSGALTSDLPVTTSGARATLRVDEAPLSVSMAFSPRAIAQGGVSRLTHTLRNDAAIGATSVALSDRLPPGVALADPPDAQTTCSGGRLTAAAGTRTIAYSEGALAAGASCTIAVDVTPATAARYRNIAESVTSSLGTSTAISAGLRVEAVEAPGFAKAFSPARVAPGGISRLTFTIDNAANAIAVRSLAFTDDFPDGMTVAAIPNGSTACGGTFAPAASATSLAFTGGRVAPGEACTIALDVQAQRAGTLENRSGALTSDLPVTTSGARATLRVDEAAAPGFAKAFSPARVDPGGISSPTFAIDNTVNAIDLGELAFTDAFTAAAPGFAKAFSPARVDPGGISRLTFTIDNAANPIEVGSLAFTDAFPDGLVAVADPPNAETSCGGIFAPAASEASLAFSGGSVAAGEACTIALDVQARRAGTLENRSGALTSDLPVARSGATATLTVDEDPLTASMSFTPATIDQGGVSTLTYTLHNGAAIEATSVALSDRLPAAVALADPPDAQTTCSGGRLTAVAGSREIAYSEGALAAGASCTIAVDVTSATAARYRNETESMTSSLGTSTAVSARLTVDAVETGTVTFKVESDTDGIFGFSSAEPVLTTSLEVNGGTASTGALSVATGSHSVSVAAPTGVALTAIACDDTDSTANVYPATISVTVDPLENVTCTLTAQSSVQPTVETINSFLTRRADLILSSEPNPGRRIERLKSGSGHVSPLRFSNRYFPTDLSLEGKGGNYSLKAQGDNYLFTAQGNNYRFSTSLLPMPEAAATADISFGSAGEVAHVENHRFDAWFEAQYKRFGDGADERGDFAIAHAGVDYLLTPDVLVGALVSFDTMEEVTATSTVSGSGYMVGPYMTARLTPNLYFDGRFAAGKSDNLISPFNTYTDSFSTSRWLAMASLTGDFQYDNWTIQPHASLSHFRETQQSYVDSVGATIPSQTVRLGQIKIGPTFTGRFEGSEGWIYAPYLTVDAIYNVDDTTGVTLTDTNGSEVEGWRGRLKAGASMTTEGGVRFSFGANYDGIGQSESETWGLMFELSIPLGGS